MSGPHGSAQRPQRRYRGVRGHRPRSRTLAPRGFASNSAPPKSPRRASGRPARCWKHPASRGVVRCRRHKVRRWSTVCPLGMYGGLQLRRRGGHRRSRDHAIRASLDVCRCRGLASRYSSRCSLARSASSLARTPRGKTQVQGRRKCGGRLESHQPSTSHDADSDTSSRDRLGGTAWRAAQGRCRKAAACSARCRSHSRHGPSARSARRVPSN
jgi:hypothetical protein